ncbi:MAG: type II toxin-antitoxin system Phd/YefM family antitoxin [Micrococcus sp.]|nr:type II toxin-antitoxin system Phd/YefM family antitoxin [Micrococcus sp.]
MATMSARAFNRDVSQAKRFAAEGPLVITDRGEPSFVLLSIDDYRRLNQEHENVVDRLTMDDNVDIDFEPVRFEWRPADL